MYCLPRTEFAPKKRHQKAGNRALEAPPPRPWKISSPGLPRPGQDPQEIVSLEPRSGIPEMRSRSVEPFISCMLNVDLEELTENVNETV